MANPSYTAAAPFHAAFLAGGFGLGRRLDEDVRNRAFAWLAAGAGSLGLWGLYQLATGNAGRGHALFETPSTLATVLNFALVPALVMFALDPRRTMLALIGVVLAAGVAATMSRGGYLALAGGLLAASLLARRLRVPLERAAPGIATVLGLGWVTAELVPYLAQLPAHVAQWLPMAPGQLASPPAQEMFGEISQASSASRLELYALAAASKRQSGP